MFRGQGGDRHENFSDTPDVALVNAAVANVARQVYGRSGVRCPPSYFYAEVRRNTFVALPGNVPADQRALRHGAMS